MPRPMAHELSRSQSKHQDVPLGKGSPNVIVHNGRAWRAEQDEFECPVDGPEKVPIGHTRVLVNDKMATRVGDFLLGAGEPDQIIDTNNRVKLGEEGVGLESDEGMKAFCQEWCQFEAEWPGLTPDERRQKYKEMLGRMFAQFGAPQPNVIFEPASTNTGGYINVVNGDYGVGDQYFTQPKAGDLRRVTFHETRHGEQLIMGIRYARQMRRQGKKLPGDNTWWKNSAWVKAADGMPDFVPGSKEEAFAATQAHGTSRGVGLDQLRWANKDYGNRYRQIPSGADANRIDGQPGSRCAC